VENAALRERLMAEQAMGRERDARIQELRWALRALPRAWADQLDRSPPSGEPDRPADPRPVRPRSPEVPPILREVEAMKARWEHRRLELEQQTLRRQRQRLAEEMRRAREHRRLGAGIGTP
jgi:hypothetical protein